MTTTKPMTARIESLREWSSLTSCYAHPEQIERAETTLYLIESRREALELLREVRDNLNPHLKYAGSVRARITKFLERNQ